MNGVVELPKNLRKNILCFLCGGLRSKKSPHSHMCQDQCCEIHEEVRLHSGALPQALDQIRNLQLKTTVRYEHTHAYANTRTHTGSRHVHVQYFMCSSARHSNIHHAVDNVSVMISHIASCKLFHHRTVCPGKKFQMFFYISGSGGLNSVIENSDVLRHD